MTLVGLAMGAGLGQENETVDQLVTQLVSSSMEERREAASSLAKLGPAAKNAVPALIIAVSDPALKYGEFPYVAPQAIRALGEIGPDAAPAVDALSKVLEGDVWDKKIVAAEALGKIGAKAAKAAPQLVRQWTIAVPRDRLIAAVASVSLVQIGVGTLPDVEKALHSEDAIIRTFAARTLGKFGPAAGNRAAKIDELIAKEKDTITKLELLNARLAIKPADRGAAGLETSISELLPVAFKIFKSQDSGEVRRALAVTAIGHSKELALPWLDQLLATARSEDDFSLRVVVAAAIAATGEKALPKIREWLKSDDFKMLETAVLVTRELGPSAKPALPELIGVAERLGGKPKGQIVFEETMCGSYAIEVIGSFGPAAKSALPVLKMLPLPGDDPAPDPLQAANAEAIQKIEGGE